jgi:urocanate hydratase
VGVTLLEGGHATAPDVIVIFTNVLPNWGNGALMKKRNYWRMLYGQSCAGAIISVG